MTNDELIRLGNEFPDWLDADTVGFIVLNGSLVDSDFLGDTLDAEAVAIISALMDEIAESLGYRLHQDPMWYPEGVRIWRWQAHGITDARIDIRGSYDSKLDALCSIGELSKKRQHIR